MKTYEKDVNLLIVDDTPQHITLASQILKPLGYPIRVATSGPAALQLIAQKKPTLILLDVQMEGLSGFDVCSHLKQSGQYNDIAIIFMTASDDEESIRRAFALGAQDYVVKPYHASELLARVNTHIKIAVQAAALRSSYDELDTFTHTVSHDLKSPLQVIRQLVGILEMEIAEGNTDDVQEVLQRLDMKSAQLIEMTERLLEFSRVGISPCSFTEVDLNALFRRQITELSCLEPERRITVHMSPLPTVSGDEALLNLLAQNIIGNALKFSRNREETILTLSCTETDTELHVTISDNGTGFDMEYAPKLFHVFSRLHKSDEYEGTGVGLSICRRIMERHGGTIDIEGVPDKGTTVTLIWRKNLCNPEKK